MNLSDPPDTQVRPHGSFVPLGESPGAGGEGGCEIRSSAEKGFSDTLLSCKHFMTSGISNRSK